jgi:hypothetical protein
MNQLFASRLSLSALIVGGGILGTALAVHDAHACTQAAEPPALLGYPEQDATEVPTDVRPIYEFSRLNGAILASDPDLAGEDDSLPEPAPFELVDEAGGVTPLLLGRRATWYLELVPSEPLAPRTRYVVRTVAEKVLGRRLQLSFTTGDGPVSAPPAPPSVEIEHYVFTSPIRSTCGPWPHGTCLRIPEQGPGVYVQADHFQQGTPYRDSYSYQSRKSWFTDIAGIDQGTPYDCVELRNRAPNGVLSEPITRCREDGVSYELSDSQNVACTSAGITVDGSVLSARAEDARGPVVDDTRAAQAPTAAPPTDVTRAPGVASVQSSSCGLVSPGRSPASLLWAAGMLLALPLRRRRAAAGPR